MPEKPEVITVVNTLKQSLLHVKIKEVEVYWNNIISYPSVEEFKEKIKDQTIYEITCRGKWILFTLDTHYLLIHLRMEGKFFFRKKEDLHNKHEHVIFTLDDQRELRYHDTRKFGKMLLVEKTKLETMDPILSLGYEYYDERLTSNYLKEKMKNKKIPIKTALLDQSIIAGIGNIYDDEILFLSKINPLTKANTLSKRKLDRIIENTRLTMEKAIVLGGSTIKSYESAEGVHGLFQNELLVHTKKECSICKSKIEKIKVNGRGTYYCPKCQK